jgi:chromosome segregation ATPase
MAASLARWIKDFKEARDAAYVARGFRQKSGSTAPEAEAETAPAPETDSSEANPSLITKLTETIKTLQTERDAANKERDDAKKLLAEVAAEATPRQQRTTELETELGDKTKQVKKLDKELRSKKALIDKMASQMQALQQALKTSMAQAESERDMLAAALDIPGMKRVMLKVTHQDAHPDADEAQQRQLTTWSQTVNAAFALLKRLKAARKDDDNAG